MKRALATIVIGPAHTEVFELTRQRMEEYAEQIDADLVVLRETQYDPPHFAKFELICHLYDAGYDKAVYMDSDIHIRQQAPNIFDEYHSAAFSEVPHPRPPWLRHSIRWIRENMVPDWPANRYFNTGVLVLDKEALQEVSRQLRGATPMPGMFFEQDQLNVLMRDAGFPKQRLEQKWNQFCGHRWITPEKANDAYFLHGCGLNTGVYKKNALKEFIEKYP